MKKLILISIICNLAISCSISTEENKTANKTAVDWSATNLLKSITEVNTHVETIDSIPIPEDCKIINPAFPLEDLFGVWAIDPHGPHADFRLDSNSFYIVDYDGDGNIPYILHEDTLTIFYGDFISRNRILKADKDSLILENEYGIVRHVPWKN